MNKTVNLLSKGRILYLLLLLFGIISSCKQATKEQSETTKLKSTESTLSNLKDTESTLTNLKDTESTLTNLKDTESTLSNLKDTEPTLSNLKDTGATLSNLKIKHILINDGFWKRKIYYKSKIKGEKYYQVRVNLRDDSKSFYFLGLRNRKIDTDTISINKVYLYELDKNKNIFIVDSLPVTKSERIYYYEYLFLSRQYDNLILKDGYLFYYKEDQNRLHETTTDNFSYRNYFKYKLGSKEQPIKIETNQLPFKEDRISIGLFDVKATTDSKKEIIALTNSANIFIFENTTWQENLHALDTISPYSISEDSKSSVNIQLSTYPQFKYHDPTEPCSLNAMFGSMSWDDKGKVLYFDNSAVCQACIWQINVKTKELVKIIPEHEAIDPFFFKENGKENIAYVYRDCIQLAHPTKNKPNPIPRNVTTFNPQNYILKNVGENPFAEIKILDKKGGEYLSLTEGAYYLGSEDSGISFYFTINKNNKLSGTYKFYANDTTSNNDMIFNQINIIDSKIDIEIISNSEYDYYYQYDQENKTYHTQQYTKTKNFVQETFFDWDDEEGELTRQTLRYNPENKTYIETHYHSNIVIEYDSLFNIKSKRDPNIGLHKFYNNDSLNKVELIGNEWLINEFEKDKFEIIRKDKSIQILEKNMDYILDTSTNNYYQFRTDNNGHIISNTLKYVKSPLE